MSYLEGIIACGLPDAVAISLADLFERAPDMTRVIQEIEQWFGVEFCYQMLPNDWEKDTL